MEILQNAVIKPHIVETLGEPVGQLWKNLQTQYTQKGDFLVASPLSRTPLPIYEWLLEHAESVPHWNKFKFVFMDDQIRKIKGKLQYVSNDDSASLEGYGRKHFLHSLSRKTHVSADNIILKPNPENFSTFDTFLEQHGGIDLLVLAIGEEGHYAMCMPSIPIETGYHAARVTHKVITQHTEKGGVAEGADFNEQAMSLGPKQVVGAKHIVIIISGVNKRELTKQLFSYTSFDPAFPMSIIFHPKVKNKVQIFLTRDVLG